MGQASATLRTGSNCSTKAIDDAPSGSVDPKAPQKRERRYRLLAFLTWAETCPNYLDIWKRLDLMTSNGTLQRDLDELERLGYIARGPKYARHAVKVLVPFYYLDEHGKITEPYGFRDGDDERVKVEAFDLAVA